MADLLAMCRSRPSGGADRRDRLNGDVLRFEDGRAQFEATMAVFGRNDEAPALRTSTPILNW